MSERSEGKRGIDPGDWIGGVIEFVQDYFESKHIILDPKAYTSLFLGIYTLIYTITFVKLHASNLSLTNLSLYAAVYVFIGYFILKLISKLKFGKSDRSLERLKEGNIAYSDLASVIGECAVKKPDEVFKLVGDYVRRGVFNEDMQIALVKNYGRYSPEYVYSLNSLISQVEFTPKALKVYLSSVKEPLEKRWKVELLDKYGHVKSFIFNLGRYHYLSVKKESIKSGKIYFMSGHKFQKQYSIVQTIFQFTGFFLIGLLFLNISVIFVMAISNSNQTETAVLFMFLILALLFLVVFIMERTIKLIIRRLLAEHEVRLSDIELDRFYNDIM